MKIRFTTLGCKLNFAESSALGKELLARGHQRASLSDVPDICVVNKYHHIFTEKEYDNICDMCKKGAIGCVACKKLLTESLNNLLDPFRERRAYYESHRDEVKDIINTGTERACAIGNETVRKVKDAMHLIV